MGLEEEVFSIRKWANQLSCPEEGVLPSEDKLKLFLKSKQSRLLLNLIDHFRPVQESTEIKRNILLKKSEKSTAEFLTAKCARHFLPKELQKYLRKQDLEKAIQQVESSISSLKEEHSSLADSIYKGNIEKLNLNESRQHLQGKLGLIEMKSDSLDNYIEREKQYREKILKFMPVRAEGNEEEAEKAINIALEKINEFRRKYMELSNPLRSSELKESTLEDLHGVIKNISNYDLFNVILKLKEEQVMNVKQMNNDNSENSKATTVTLKQPSASSSSQSAFSSTSSSSSATIEETNEDNMSFEDRILKAKGNVILLFIERVRVEHGTNKLKQDFFDIYEKKHKEVEMIIKKNSSGTEDSSSISDIIARYFSEFNTKNFTTSEIEFISKEIKDLEEEVSRKNVYIGDHEALIGSIVEIYQEIEYLILRIEAERAQLNQIKDKIIYSKNLLASTLQNLSTNIKYNNTQIMTATMGNFPPSSPPSFLSNRMSRINNNYNNSMDSFNISNISDVSVLCSTKLENNLDNNLTGFARRFETSMMIPTDSVRMPSHKLELATFMETPIQKLQVLPVDCVQNIILNPLITECPALGIQHVPYSLLTPKGVLLEIEKMCILHNQIKELLKCVKPETNIPKVNADEIAAKVSKQNENISQLLHEIQTMDNTTKRSLQKMKKCYDFILKNPLKKYIPPGKKLNNQTYEDYEREFLMYHRMITGIPFNSKTN